MSWSGLREKVRRALCEHKGIHDADEIRTAIGRSEVYRSSVWVCRRCGATTGVLAVISGHRDAIRELLEAEEREAG